MRIYLDNDELSRREELNYRRLVNTKYYQIERVFSPKTYSWQGDKEGRALLAFMSHYKMSGRKIPCMEQMLDDLSDKMNSDFYFGPLVGEIIDEQQLSGHSWLLRGLCEHYEQFRDAFSLNVIEKIVRNLYLPTRGHYGGYPIERPNKKGGGVSGHSSQQIGEWLLSTDIGCAFMSIDGLSHAFAILKDATLKDLLDEMIAVFLAIDKVALQCQTHCTLSAARGLMRLYAILGNSYYLDGAKAIFDLYVNGGGMTYTYQNINWWGRNDTWTEPCAIIDSLILACELYKAEQNPTYRTLAARIYHNGFATLQRPNGGAGTDSVVTQKAGGVCFLKALMYEAEFCCTMRLAEGLWYIKKNQELLYAETAGQVTKNENGVYTDGDIIYVKIEGKAVSHAVNPVTVDGMTLYPILKYYTLSKDIIRNTYQTVIFE